MKQKYGLLLFLFFSAFTLKAEVLPIVQGILDLSGASLENIMTLEGEWAFYSDTKSLYLKVPASWESAGIDPGQGEYRLRIILPENNRERAALFIPDLSQIVEVEINGELLASAGDYESGRIGNSRILVPFDLEDIVDVKLRIRNTGHRVGGLQRTPLLGSYEDVVRFRSLRIVVESVIVGILFFVALFHFFLFANKYSNRAALFLGISALVYMIRGLNTGENIIFFLFPDYPWFLYYKTGFIAIYITAISTLSFVYVLFCKSSGILKFLYHICVLSGALLAIVSCFLNLEYLSLSIYVLQGYILFCYLVSFIIFFSALFRREKGSAIFLMGLILFFTFTLIDIFGTHGKPIVLIGSQIGMVLFLLTQAFVLSRLYGEAFLKSKRLGSRLEMEVLERTDDLNKMNLSLKEEIKIRKEAESRLRILSSTDPLTGAANRLRINDELDAIHSLYLRNGTGYCVIMFDIDHFKKVNDKFGHSVGDDVLRMVVQYTGEELRGSDVLARWGGEEFLICLPQIDLDGAVVAAERIRQRLVSESYGQVPRVSASFGVVESTDKEALSELLRRADVNLYRAKEQGRNRVVS